MDPKKISDLDPKLKEVYERVMGTKVPNSQPSGVTPQSPKIMPPKATTPLKQEAVAQKTTSQPLPINVQVFTTKGESKQTIPGEKNGRSPFLAIILAIAGLIFFVIYGLFWVRFFNIKLPFTLPF